MVQDIATNEKYLLKANTEYGKPFHIEIIIASVMAVLILITFLLVFKVIENNKIDLLGFYNNPFFHFSSEYKSTNLF